MRWLLPLILSACAAEAAQPRPDALAWSAVSVDCVDGMSQTPSVPGAMVQAAACTDDGACWSAQWGEEAGAWRANCSQGATVVEWTWIAPVRS